MYANVEMPFERQVEDLSTIVYMSLPWESAVFLARNIVPLYLTFNQIRELPSITYSRANCKKHEG